MSGDPRTQFREAIERAGITPPEHVIADGAMHRYATDGTHSDDAGWYVMHGDGIPAGAAGDWRSGADMTWRADIGRDMTDAERDAQRERIARARQQREQADAQRAADAARRATEIWEAAAPAPADHPYLAARGVLSYGLRIYRGPLAIGGLTTDGALVLPLRDATGALHSLEFINGAGEKRFLPGGRVTGCYHSIGKPTDVLCIAEGFATAASVHHATGYAVACATSAGNLEPVARALREKFPAARIVIAADHDASGTGERKATEAASAIGGHVAMPATEGTDWNDVMRTHGVNAVRDGIAGAATPATIGASVATVTAPEPLRRPTPPPEPYPLADLGPLLTPAAESLRRVIQAPDAVCGASLLAAASLATQAHADVLIDGRIVPLTLWMLTVAESGERKSAVDAVAMTAARDYERELAEVFEDEKAEHDARLAEWQARREAAATDAKKIKGRGLAEALRDIGDEPPAPLLPRVLAADFTAEGLTKLLAAGWPSMGAFTDEAALVFGGHGMTKETTMRTAATLCKLWDSGTLDRVRALDGAMKLHGRRLALHLMAQPVIAERALADDVLAGQGFLARCLLAWPESTAGTRTYCAQSLRDDAALSRVAERLCKLHRLPLPLADGERQKLEPRTLTLAADAKRAWITLHDGIERHMSPTGEYATVRPWASKTPEQALRIAGVLTLLADPHATIIDAETIAHASELALWHLREAVRLAGTAALSPEVRDAEALLGWCHATGRERMHSRDALRLGPSRVREGKAFRRAMAELVRAGWAIPIDGGAVIDGAHRRYVWRITQGVE